MSNPKAFREWLVEKKKKLEVAVEMSENEAERAFYEGRVWGIDIALKKFDSLCGDVPWVDARCDGAERERLLTCWSCMCEHGESCNAKRDGFELMSVKDYCHAHNKGRHPDCPV